MNLFKWVFFLFFFLIFSNFIFFKKAFKSLGLNPDSSKLASSNNTTPNKKNDKNDKKKSKNNPEKEENFSTNNLSQNFDQSPKFLIANEKNFSALYQILLKFSKMENDEKSSEISMRVWLLLNLLPLNKEFLKKIQTLDNTIQNNEQKVDWEKIIETDSIFKQLYSLKILSNLLSSESFFYGDLSQEQFMKVFVEKGGFNFIISIFKGLKWKEEKKNEELNQQLAYFQSVLYLLSSIRNTVKFQKKFEEIPKIFDSNSPKELLDQIFIVLEKVAENTFVEVQKIGGNLIESGLSVIKNLISNDIETLLPYFYSKNLKEW